jgi:hypothetical protein
MWDGYRGGNTEKLFVGACRDELFSHHLYRSLASKPFVGRGIREALLKASEDEYRHYIFWKSTVGECSDRFLRLRIFLYTLMLYLFGLTATLKYLECA